MTIEELEQWLNEHYGEELVTWRREGDGVIPTLTEAGLKLKEWETLKAQQNDNQSQG